MMRFFPIIGLVALVAALAVLLVFYPTEKDGVIRRASALPTLKLSALDPTSEWDQASLNGHVTLINVMASWCVPCAAEMPELAALGQDFPDVRIEAIAWNDTPATLHPWLAEHGNPFHAVWIDNTGDSAIALGVRGVPETFILDAKGMIRGKVSGIITQSSRASVLDPLIRKLQEEAANGH